MARRVGEACTVAPILSSCIASDFTFLHVVCMHYQRFPPWQQPGNLAYVQSDGSLSLLLRLTVQPLAPSTQLLLLLRWMVGGPRSTSRLSCHEASSRGMMFCSSSSNTSMSLEPLGSNPRLSRSTPPFPDSARACRIACLLNKQGL